MNWFDYATENYGYYWFSAMEEAYPERWRCFDRNIRGATLVKRNPTLDKLAVIISGGGSDGPLFPGFVGEGLADACVVGSPYSAPNAYSLYEIGKEIGKEKGILFIYNNFAGDYLNNDFAAELLRLEGYMVKSVAAWDDMGSAIGEPRENRGGRCSIALLIKIAASCASKGYSLEQTHEIVAKANNRSSTLSVVMDPKTREVSFGKGFSGEPAFASEVMDVEQTAQKAIRLLLDDIKLQKDEQLVVLVNRLKLTSYGDSYNMAYWLKSELDKHGGVYQLRVGAYNNILDDYGYTVTILAANESITPHLKGLVGSDSFML